MLPYTIRKFACMIRTYHRNEDGTHEVWLEPMLKIRNPDRHYITAKRLSTLASRLQHDIRKCDCDACLKDLLAVTSDDMCKADCQYEAERERRSGL